MALFLGETELLTTLPPPYLAAITAGLTALLLARYFLSPALRARIHTWPDRWLVAIHLTRFVGIYFLILSKGGLLEATWAIPAGWGDIVVATGALAFIFLPLPRSSFVLWNMIGLLDIFLVVGRATALRVVHPEALMRLTQLPLSFLPTFLVPLIIATHVILLLRNVRTERKRPREDLRATMPTASS